jgi:GTP-binding protein
VGKSTLFNRLVRKRKALVGDLSGITRDRNYAVAEYDGRPFLLIDTGGFIPDPRESLMTQMKLQVQLAIEEAEKILFVMDAREGLTPLDREIYDFLRVRNKAVFPVVNKVDGPRQEEEVYEFYELGVERLYGIAAEQGTGIGDLMDELVETFPSDEFPPEPGSMRISVIGKPNVGKSTLINSLIGEKRLITSDVPGTTRDTIDTPLIHDGQSYLLIDTAGIRKKSKVTHRIETYSVIMVLKSIERSDLCLILIDATAGVTEQDLKIAGLAHEAGAASILLLNKWDRARHERERKQLLEDIRVAFKFMDYAPALFISALTGYGLDKIFPLVEKIKDSFYKRVTTSRVNQALRQAVTRHEPPFYRKNKLRFYYGTQIDTAPPTFVIFSNAPAGVHFSYRRYLSNALREALGFPDVPIRMFLKKRN